MGAPQQVQGYTGGPQRPCNGTMTRGCVAPYRVAPLEGLQSNVEKLMLKTFNDVDEVAIHLLHEFKRDGIFMNSRNGNVLRLPGVTGFTLNYPDNCWLRWGARKHNPFLHFFEAMWNLAGRNDVETLKRFAPNMDRYAEGGVLRGAYGHRWTNHFVEDQLSHVVGTLREDPESRRAVLTMTDPNIDWPWGNTKDIPCNLSVSFHVYHGKLHATVFNRSNDLIWGMLGTNVVLFSVLLNFVSEHVGIPMGTLSQVSSNCHIYQKHFKLLWQPPTSRRLVRNNKLFDANVDDLDLALSEVCVTLDAIRENNPAGSQSSFKTTLGRFANEAWRIWDTWMLYGDSGRYLGQYEESMPIDLINSMRKFLEFDYAG